MPPSTDSRLTRRNDSNLLGSLRDIFQICPRVPGRDFDSLPYEEDTMSFLRELSYTREINSLNDVVVNQMHQPWRTFSALINRRLSGKTSRLDKFCLSRAQILWVMYYQTYVDYVELFWEDFIYQIENRVYKKQEKILAMKESKAYKTYLCYATCAIPPKIARKFKKTSPSKKDNDLVHIDEEPVTKGKRVKRSVKKSSSKPATESWRNDKDDINDDNDTENEGNDKENKSDDDKTPFDSEKGLDSEQDTDGSESNSEYDQQEYEEEVKDDDEDDKSKEITQEQVVKDAHVMITTVAKETEVPNASFSHLSDLASKFLIFLDIHPNDVEIVSPLDVDVHHEVPRIHTSTLLTILVSVIPKASPDVTELKKDPLHTQVTALVDDHLDTRIGAAREEFINFLSESLTARKCLTSLNLDRKDDRRQSRKDKDKDEVPSVGSDRVFKKRKTIKDADPTTEEPEFEVGDTDMRQGQEGIWVMMMLNLGKSLPLDMTGSQNLHDLKNPLILTGM
uniref:Uncharacterized protein n=1 Tax=Tanacetum cinerariifolium TaxID=118510 RepID=A0A699J599_TANCI|nr:hypothetical protein [Tanacetum cinerariifolium]